MSVRRITAAILLAVLLLMMVPVGTVGVLAAGMEQSMCTGELPAPIFETNPRYCDHIGGESPILNSDNSVGESAPVLYAVSSLDEAARILRQTLENRLATVTIAFQPSYDAVSEDAYYIWDTALAETGVPTQGDYLQWHWKSWGCTWDYSKLEGAYRYSMTFKLGYYTTAAQETELTKQVNSIISGFGFTSATTDYEKAKTIHAWVTDNITYDYTSSGTGKQTAYNGVMYRTCVCQGYATIMYRMLWQVGVPARVVAGDTNATPTPSSEDTGDNHGWNIVKLGDLWYNLDATWDAGLGAENWGYFLTCPDSFGGHYRWPEYDTAAFHTAYPMAAADYTPQSEIVKFDFMGTNMALDNSLAMNFAFSTSHYSDWSGFYAQIVKEYADGREDVTVTIPAEDWSNRGSYYMVTYNGVTAKEMADNFYITIYNADGQAVSVTRTDSVRAYARRTLDKSSTAAALKTVIVDMLNYGAAAQIHFGYGTDDLANNDLSDAEKALASAEVEVADSRVKGEGFAGSQLTLESNIQLAVIFSKMTEGKTAKAVYTDARGEEKTVDCQIELISGGYGKVLINALAVADYNSLVAVTIYNADGSVYSTASDSVASYVYRNNISTNVDANLRVLGQELVKFAHSAYNYFV